MESKTITWDRKFETGHPVVDGQHKNLFILINRLTSSTKERNDKLTLLENIEKLRDYVENHFTTEEDLMLSVSYPLFSIHKKAHEELRQQSQKLIKLFLLDKVDLTATIANFLSEWLRIHILEVDLKMIEWVKENSLKKVEKNVT